MMVALAAALLLAAPAPAKADDPLVALMHSMQQAPPTANAAQVARLLKLLEGRVTNKETEQILNTLTSMDAPQLLGTLAALERAPWKGNRSQFDKFLARGIDDRKTFLAEFADLLNDRFALGLTPLSKLYELRRQKLGVKPRFDAKAKRQANRDMVRNSKELYKYLGLKDKLGLKAAANSVARGLAKAGVTVAEVITAPIWIPLFLIFAGTWNFSMD